MLAGLVLGVRRLHDSNRSGWWMLLCLPWILTVLGLVWVAIASAAVGSVHLDFPTVVHAVMACTPADWLIASPYLMALAVGVASGLTLFVFMCWPATKGTNRFGADPRKRSERPA
jgi:uncharacterized membrane protein YhaH (DUF805 family)